MPSERVRLLKFLTLFAIGGTERQVVNLVRQLDRSKFDLSLACFQQSGEFLEDLDSLHVPISEYKINCLYNHRTLLQQFRLARFLRRQGTQVLHTYGFYPTIFAVPAARLARVPAIVVSIRDTGDMLTEWQRRAQKLVCRLADSVLVNAEAVRHWLITQGYQAEKIEVIRNGIALDRFGKGRGSIRQELGLSPSVPLIAMLSRLSRLKGAEYFLEAAASVSSSFPDVRFLIVGDAAPNDSAYKTELMQRARRLGLQDRVIFTGFRLDVAELLADVTVSVLPSLSEGLSNSLLESMAAGVPVVATNVGGNPEVIEDGVSGMLVPLRDSQALANALCNLLAHPELAHRYGKAGIQRIVEHFSLDGMVHRTEQHYLKLLASSSPSPTVSPMEALV